MMLTPAGEILQEKFEGMMREFERVKSHIAALQDIQAGTVDVYCFQRRSSVDSASIVMALNSTPCFFAHL
jgi:hypothetical protein